MQTKIEERKEQERTVAAKTSDLQQRKSELEGISNQYRNTTNTRSQTESTLKTVVGKIQRTETKLNATVNDLERNRQEKTNYDERKHEFKSNITTLQIKIERHKRAIQQHQERMNENKNDLHRANDHHQKQTNIVQQLKTKLEHVKQGLGEKVNLEKSKVREMSQQQALMDSDQKSRQELQNDINNNQQKLAAIQQQLETTNDEIREIVTRTNDLENEKKSLGKDLNEKQRLFNNFEQAHRETQMQMQVQISKVESPHRTLANMSHYEHKLFKHIKTLETKLDKKGFELGKNQKAIDRANKNVQKVQNEEVQARKTIEKQKIELSLIKEEILERNEKINRHEGPFNELRQRLLLSQDKFQRNENEVLETYRKIERLQNTITKRREHHCEIQEKLEQKSFEIIDRELVQKGRKNPTSGIKLGVEPKIQ